MCRLLSVASAENGGGSGLARKSSCTPAPGSLNATVPLKVLVDAGLLARDKRGVWSYILIPEALGALAMVLTPS